MPMRRRFALVFNSQAGVAFPRLLGGVVRALRDASADVFQLAARSAEEATERVRELAHRREADAVIAAGGDGTYRAVAWGAAGTDLPVGVIPLGTGNIIAREIGLARHAGAISAVLRSGPVIETKGGLVDGAPFFLMVGAGFDARIVSLLNYRTKRALGRAAYTYPFLKTLAEGPQLFDVEIDGRSYEASWAVVGFASRFGGSFVLTRETQVGRENMTVTLIEARSRLKLMSSAVGLGLGTLADPDRRPAGVRSFPAKVVRIGRRALAPIEIDGDQAGMSPVQVSAEGPSVRLIVPERYVADLTNRHANHLG